MVGAIAGGQEPYPEPVQPPDAPLETPPIDAPQEEPSQAPFNDDGRPIDFAINAGSFSSNRPPTGGKFVV